MNRIDQLFAEKKNILSVYFTCGYPKLEDTAEIIKALVKNGVDMIEIGLPFSDPLADGPIIQNSSTIALENGITSKKILEQLQDIRQVSQVPLVAMGYLNPVLQFGLAEFLCKLNEIGIDGLILPDMPAEVYELEYKTLFEKYKIYPIFLITPQTSNERIAYLDSLSKGFVYMVSSASTTGAKEGFGDVQANYFERISKLSLKNPKLIGFGIKDKSTFDLACQYAQGAIIGSAYIKALENGEIPKSTEQFIGSIRGQG